MTALRVLRRPGFLLTMAAFAVVLVLHPAPGAAAFGVLGMLIGALIALNALQLGMVLGAVTTRARLHKLVLGIGGRVWDRSTPEFAFVVRTLPVVLWVSIGPGRAPVRPRMAIAAAVSLLAGTAAVAALVTAAVGSGQAFWLGAALTGALVVLPELRPDATARGTTVGWLLFRVPRLTGRDADRLDAAPAIGDAIHAASHGDLDTADRLADQLLERYPNLPTASAARLVVLQLRGRYVEAMQLAVRLAGDRSQTPREAAVNFAVLAYTACLCVEAGQLDAELGLGTARTGLENAHALGFPQINTAGTRALLALHDGDTAQAVFLATASARDCDNLLDRADALATLAAAHTASGDNVAARGALGEAERIAGWMPRVRFYRARLSVG